MEINKFKQLVREKRFEMIPQPSYITKLNFISEKFDNQNEDFFLNNASYIITTLRNKNWETFSKLEAQFSSEMYEMLIDTSVVTGLTNVEAIKWFVNQYPEHIYALSLSNTQSRRSRAGKEFEQIIELILMGANIPFDTQGSIGSGIFESANLAKLVDCVSPGAVEYKLNKRNTSLISAKTTLRERWQEVGDEMARTKAREMYLITLDEKISDNVMSLISKNNIVLVSTIENINNNYSNSHNILSVEEMLEELKTKALSWNRGSYDVTSLNEKKEFLNTLKDNSSFDFEEKYYMNQLQNF